MRVAARLLLFVSLSLAVACGEDTNDRPDTSDTPDTFETSDPSDTPDAPSETSEPDTEPGDTQPNDTEPNDTEPGDTQPNDTEPGDTQPNDTEPGDTDTTPDGEVVHPPIEPLFSTELVRDIRIALDPAEWARLRREKRSFLDTFAGECLASPRPSPFTWYRATVTVDGVTLGEVGVRKKGWIGSVNRDRPSLRLKFDRYIEDQDLAGFENLVLNNSVQDPSLVRQCLGYALFEAVGLPSPRCGFARVRVNDEDLGAYVMVESVNKDFLRARFTNPNGNMYEGVFSDFRDGWTGSFEPETNEGVTTKDDLLAVTEALGSSDAELLANLEPHLDLDRFLTYWAMELLIRHRDGYAQAANNFHVLADLDDDGRFVFIPHGIDAIMNDIDPAATPSAFMLSNAALTSRLIDHPPTRAALFSEVERILEAHWDVAALTAEVERMAAVVRPHTTELTRHDASVAELLRFIARRPDFARTAMAGTTFAGTLANSPCWPITGTFEVTFDAPYGSLLGGPGGTASGSLTLGSTPVTLTGSSRLGKLGDNETLTLTLRSPSNENYRVDLALDPARLATGTSDLNGRSDLVSLYRPEDNVTTLFAYGGPGTLVFTQASPVQGARVVGRISGSVVEIP